MISLIIVTSLNQVCFRVADIMIKQSRCWGFGLLTAEHLLSVEKRAARHQQGAIAAGEVIEAYMRETHVLGWKLGAVPAMFPRIALGLARVIGARAAGGFRGP
jgi:hypothetical protein